MLPLATNRPECYTRVIIVIVIIIILHPCCDCGWYVWFWIIDFSFVLEQTCLFLMCFLLLLLQLLFCFLSTRQNVDELYGVMQLTTLICWQLLSLSLSLSLCAPFFLSDHLCPICWNSLSQFWKRTLPLQIPVINWLIYFWFYVVGCNERSGGNKCSLSYSETRFCRNLQSQNCCGRIRHLSPGKSSCDRVLPAELIS